MTELEKVTAERDALAAKLEKAERIAGREATGFRAMCEAFQNLEAIVGLDTGGGMGPGPALNAVESISRERDALKAHVERFNALYRRATEEDAGWMTNSHVVKEYAAICRDTPETSLAKRDAEKQAEALEAAKTACIQIEEGQESLAWMHTTTMDDGEKVIDEYGIPYSNKAFGAQHCADEIGRMAREIRRQAGGDA